MQSFIANIAHLLEHVQAEKKKIYKNKLEVMSSSMAMVLCLLLGVTIMAQAATRSRGMFFLNINCGGPH